MESSLLGTPMARLYFVLDRQGVVFSKIQQNKALVFLQIFFQVFKELGLFLRDVVMSTEML